MGVEVVHDSLVWDLVLTELPRNTSFQRAFHCVPEEVVRCGLALGFKKRFRVGHPNVGEQLQIRAIHRFIADIVSCGQPRPARDRYLKN